MSDWSFGHLTPMKYGAILADPPWAYVMRSDAGYEKSPESHYATMDIDALAALDVQQLAGPDCYLFLWSTWPHLPQALWLMQQWGFDYVTGGSWTKRTQTGKLAFGTGYVLRSACEPYLVGKIGRPRIVSRSERNVILAPEDVPDSIESVRREHSRKPIEMREMIGRLLPHSFCCELFAREPWAEHDVWGNETCKFGGEYVEA
ncbi:S-adenosylmethionine-binding protein [Ruegeria sediminis]|uniref:S-adenosylmethionine-binding protein n=1 Tax=Ruegeria sediminis TaxID=2583820 RepID=A0ABY2X389_9RHOB|nr:MT-A70 family methyltransferase [Ruegeria sediminis]TMV09841.1 S-adenosylmethionine-binding protein [Ruegeria sediminis]